MPGACNRLKMKELSESFDRFEEEILLQSASIAAKNELCGEGIAFDTYATFGVSAHPKSEAALQP